MAYSIEGESGDVLGRKMVSYQDYVKLWIDLLHPSKLKVRSLQS